MGSGKGIGERNLADLALGSDTPWSPTRGAADSIAYAHSAGPGMIRKRLEELFGDRFGDAGKMHRKQIEK